jgi:hypothetical protein
MERSSRADLVSAYAIGVGAGLVALQVAWLILNRLTGLVWGPPLGPTIAFGSAIIVGIVVSIIAGKRLARTVNTPQQVPNGTHT